MPRVSSSRFGFAQAEIMIAEISARLRANRSLWVVWFGLLLLAAAPAAAQTGRLSGTVRDQKQGVVAGAKVSVRDAANRVVDTQVTKADGTFAFSSLPPGIYQVEAQAPSFRLFITHGVRVTAGDNPSLDITLVLEAVASTVVVEGTAENGYKTQSASNVGPFANTNIQDTPYSITVVPHELLQNLQPSSAEQVFEMVPGLQVSLPQGIGDGIRINSRGFWVDSGEDGFRFVDYNIGPIAIEDKERVELTSGLSGFLYGPMDPGGFANYVLKRPTATRFESVTLGDYGGTSGYIHVDLGGPIDKKDRFGYRVNVVGQGLGDTAVQDQKIERALFSGAFDWHISHRALLQLDGEWNDYRLEGQSSIWFLGNYIYSPPPDASKDWGDPFSFTKYRTTHAGADFEYDFTDKLSLRAGYRFMWYRNDFIFVGNEPNSTVNDGTYNQFVNHTEDFTATSQDSRILMDYSFHTGPVSHDLTFGFMSWHSSARTPANDRFFPTVQPVFSLIDPAGNAAASNAIQANLNANPIVLGAMQDVGTDYSYSRMVGDRITFSPSWMAIAGINYAGVLTQSYPVGPNQKYDKNAWTPTASLIYKPVSNVSTYFTYMQGLEEGGFAGSPGGPSNLPVTNPGYAPPSVDSEYEAGVKASIGKAQLNAAFFDVTQANDQYILNSAGNMYTYDSSGRESHKGVEIDLTGKVLPGLSLFGGATLMDPKIVKDPDNPASVGQQPINVSRYFGKLYAEYEIPGVRGLVLTGGFQSYSRAPIGQPNQIYTPAYAVGDLGARYTAHVLDHDTIFRINTANFTNESYWNSSDTEGDPLSVSFSMQIVF